MKCLIFLAAAVVTVATALGQASDQASAKFQYDAAVAAIHSTRMDGERNLAALYTNALTTLRTKAQNEGNLDKVKLILAEAARFEKERAAPATPLAATELQNLTASFVKRSREIEVNEATDVLKQAQQFDATLATLQTSLTKQGKFDEASKVQDERKSLAASEAVVSARAVLTPGFVAPPKPAPAPALNIAELLTSPNYEWSAPENLGPNVNGPADDNHVCVSEDGLSLVFSSARNGHTHVFESRRTSVTEPFGAPIPVDAISTPATEITPFIAADGLTLLYSTKQGPNGLGDMDLYETHRRSRTAQWEKPANLGPVVNTAASECAPCLSRDGLTLLFHSKRPGGQGDYDIWRSRRKSQGTSWEEPENLGPRVNSTDTEFMPRFAPDNRSILFNGFGRRHRLFMAVPAADGELSVRPLDLPVKGDTDSAWLTPDGRTLYFASDCPGGQGGWDIWLCRRVPKAK